MEHLEHVPGRMGGTITSGFGIFAQYSEISGNSVGAMESPNKPFDRVHRFVRLTQWEHFEHVPGRIGGRITSRF
ncbi:unnamed protein product, partial [Rotaria sp. Silwood2]